MQKMKLKLVCFDLDGVLADACELHKQSLNEALEQSGYSKISDFDHVKTYNGLPTLSKLSKLGIPSNEANQINKLKQEITVKRISDHIKFDLTKVVMCAAIKNSGVKLACVSNCSKQTGELMLKNIGILDYFNICVWNDGCRPKPCSEGYIISMVELRSKPSETIIVEDSPHGIQSARNTGALVFEVANPSQVNFNLFKDYL